MIGRGAGERSMERVREMGWVLVQDLRRFCGRWRLDTKDCHLQRNTNNRVKYKNKEKGKINENKKSTEKRTRKKGKTKKRKHSWTLTHPKHKGWRVSVVCTPFFFENGVCTFPSIILIISQVLQQPKKTNLGKTNSLLAERTKKAPLKKTHLAKINTWERVGSRAPNGRTRRFTATHRSRHRRHGSRPSTHRRHQAGYEHS
jgi:hypothetical protein